MRSCMINHNCSDSILYSDLSDTKIQNSIVHKNQTTQLNGKTISNRYRIIKDILKPPQNKALNRTGDSPFRLKRETARRLVLR